MTSRSKRSSVIDRICNRSACASLRVDRLIFQPYLYRIIIFYRYIFIQTKRQVGKQLDFHVVSIGPDGGWRVHKATGAVLAEFPTRFSSRVSATSVGSEVPRPPLSTDSTLLPAICCMCVAIICCCCIKNCCCCACISCCWRKILVVRVVSAT